MLRHIRTIAMSISTCAMWPVTRIRKSGEAPQSQVTAVWGSVVLVAVISIYFKSGEEPHSQVTAVWARSHSRSR